MIRRFLILAHCCAVVIMVSGCSFSAGGWSACFLDNADIIVRVQHAHGAVDPNAPN